MIVKKRRRKYRKDGKFTVGAHGMRERQEVRHNGRVLEEKAQEGEKGEGPKEVRHIVIQPLWCGKTQWVFSALSETIYVAKGLEKRVRELFPNADVVGL